MITVPAQPLWQLPWGRLHDTCSRKMPQILIPSSRTCCRIGSSTALMISCCESCKSPATTFSRRNLLPYALFLTISSHVTYDSKLAEAASGYKEYFDKFDGYAFKYPRNWIQVRGANADIFFRDPVNLDENVSVEITSPSSSRFTSVEDLGPPESAGNKVLKQYLTEFMSTRLGVRRESNILSSSSRVADDGRLYYEIEVNVKSFANSNQLAVMPQDRIAQLEWDRRYLSVLGVENNCLYELRLQTPEKVFAQEESDLRQ
ncbi:hypothetical protein KI387_023678, partial [Taxus chinensis]